MSAADTGIFSDPTARGLTLELVRVTEADPKGFLQDVVSGQNHHALADEPLAYGGTNKGNQGRVVAHASEVKGLGPYADLYLPPMSTLFLKYDPS